MEDNLPSIYHCRVKHDQAERILNNPIIMKNKNRKIGILTGGGDTQPLNALIFSLRNLLARDGFEFFGFEKGWEGILRKKYADLRSLPDFGGIGGTVLRSSRVNLSTDDGFRKANQNLSDLGLAALVVVGGDDTLSNVYGIESVPCIGISKTIDNDVGSLSVINGKIKTVNCFTLGYPTAADKIARLVSLEEGIRTTAYSHERILIVESMGMHAGWLAMASAFGKPDFIIVPEFPLDYPSFLRTLMEQYARDKNTVVVIAEGARFGGGEYMNVDPSEKDAFGHSRFGGSGQVLRDRLKTDLKGFMDARNVNSVNPSYLYRSGAAGSLDVSAACRIAEKCFQMLSENKDGEHQFIHIEKKDSGFTAESCPFSDFKKTGQGRFPKRHIDRKFYNPDAWSATDLWFEYLSPIVSFRPSDLRYGLY